MLHLRPLSLACLPRKVQDWSILHSSGFQLVSDPWAQPLRKAPPPRFQSCPFARGSAPTNQHLSGVCQTLQPLLVPCCWVRQLPPCRCSGVRSCQPSGSLRVPAATGVQLGSCKLPLGSSFSCSFPSTCLCQHRLPQQPRAAAAAWRLVSVCGRTPPAQLRYSAAMPHYILVLCLAFFRLDPSQPRH